MYQMLLNHIPMNDIAECSLDNRSAWCVSSTGIDLYSKNDSKWFGHEVVMFKTEVMSIRCSILRSEESLALPR